MHSVLVMIWMADCSVMAYTYRKYYGRHIFHEFDDDEDQQSWIYDANTHKYRRLTASEIEENVVKMESARKSLAILEHKKEIRAARVIQRWWRGCLYNPPNGIFYKQAMVDFNGIRDDSGTVKSRNILQHIVLSHEIFRDIL